MSEVTVFVFVLCVCVALCVCVCVLHSVFAPTSAGLVRKKVAPGQESNGPQDGTGKKKRKAGGGGGGRRKNQTGISADNLLIDRKKVKVESSILNGDEIYVVNPAQKRYQVSDECKRAYPHSEYAKVKWTKQDVDRMVLRLGGKITCNTTVDTKYIVSAYGSEHMSLKGIVQVRCIYGVLFLLRMGVGG